MRYTLQTGKNINIPDKDIARSMEVLKITKDEAIQVWLEDEGYIENVEQTKLEEKAKTVKIKHGAKSTAPKKEKAKKEKTQKPDPEKEMLIKLLFEAIQSVADESEITNKTKLIVFKRGNDTYKIDLIRRTKNT